MGKNSEKLDKLDLLTLEADMLSRVLHDAISVYEEMDGICEIYYQSEILRKKFRKIRAVF
jgi:hypothetical protein